MHESGRSGRHVELSSTSSPGSGITSNSSCTSSGSSYTSLATSVVGQRVPTGGPDARQFSQDLRDIEAVQALNALRYKRGSYGVIPETQSNSPAALAEWSIDSEMQFRRDGMFGVPRLPRRPMEVNVRSDVYSDQSTVPMITEPSPIIGPQTTGRSDQVGSFSPIYTSPEVAGGPGLLCRPLHTSTQLPDRPIGLASSQFDSQVSENTQANRSPLQHINVKKTTVEV